MARVLTYTQLEQLWQQAGGGSGSAKVAAAIAEAESGGRVNAKHHNANGSTDYGLWQINSVHGYNAHKLVTDPLYNARAAVAVYHGSGWGAWTTYQTGAYKKYLQGSVTTNSSSSGTTSSGFILPFNTKTTQGPTQADEGLDFTSSTNYLAVAPGRIEHIDPNFWKGTPAVYERLDTPVTVNGHKYTGVYYSETSSLVTVGQHVNAGDPVIGPGNAEIGFAKRFGSSLSSWLPAAHGQYHGQPKGTQASYDFTVALNPALSQFASGNILAKTAANPFVEAANATGIPQAVGGITGFFDKLTKVQTWIRIGEVVGGGILILLGLYLLTKQIGLGGFDVPDAVSPAARRAQDAADKAAQMRTADEIEGRRRSVRAEERREEQHTAQLEERAARADAARARAETARTNRQPRTVHQHYIDTPTGKTRRTRELAKRGRERPSDDIPY